MASSSASENSLPEPGPPSSGPEPPSELSGTRFKAWISEEESGSEFGGTYKFKRYHIHSLHIVGQQRTELWRRYSDFYSLRELLLQLFPGLYVPPLPPKRVLQMPLVEWSHEDFLKERFVDLNRFLARCAEIPPLRECHAFQVFLSDSDLPFKAAVKNKSLAHCDRTDSAVLERLQQNFGHSVGRLVLPEDPSSHIQQLAQTFDVSRDALLAARVALDRVYTSGAAFAAEFKYLISQMDDLRTSEVDYCKKYAPDFEQRINVTPQLSSLREWSAYATAFLPPLLAVFRREWHECMAYSQLINALDQLHQVCDRQRRKIGQLSQKKQNPKVEAQLEEVQKEYEDSNHILQWRQRFLLSESERAKVWTARVQRYTRCISKIVQSQLMSTRQQLEISWSMAFQKDAAQGIPLNRDVDVGGIEDEEKSPADGAKNGDSAAELDSEDEEGLRYL